MTLPLLIHQHTNKQIEQYLQSPTHGLALSGEDGAGKGYLAMYIASRLLNTDFAHIVTNSNIMKVDTVQKKTGIDDIREVQKYLTLTVPGSSDVRRIVIIEHIDNLGHEAQNALLKTLEEPPVDTVLVITYARDAYLLPTIHSRLQNIRVLPATQAMAGDYFKNVSEKEFLKAFFISNGQPGLLFALLNHEANHPLIEAIERARKIIGLTRYNRLAQVDALVKDKEISPSNLLDGLYRLVDASYRQSVKSKSNHDLKASAGRLALIEKACDDLDHNVQAKLVLSRLFLEL